MSDREALPCIIVKRSPDKRRVRKNTPFVDSDEDLDHVDESVIGDDGEDGLDDEEDSLDDVQGPRPQFQTVAQGPLGALSIINNRQMAAQQMREMEDLLPAVEPDHEQVEIGVHGQEWAELHATLDKLIKKKDQVRKVLEEFTETADANYSELGEWMKKFSSIGDFGWDKLFTLRDKLPPNMGPALIRLVAFYYPDDISMDQLPNWYKEMLHTDLQRLAKSSVPPVPSQSIPALKADLQSASGTTKKLEREVKRKDARIEEVQLQLDMRSSEVASLNERLKSLRNRYEGGSSRLMKMNSELQDSKDIAERKLKTLRKEHSVTNKLLVSIQEEKQGLAEELQERQGVIKEKDVHIQQLKERVQKLVEVGEDSSSALETLKGTVRHLQETSTKNQEEAQKTLDRLHEQSRSARDRQQQRINEKDSEIQRLKTENDKIGHLQQEKGRLEQQVATLKSDNSSLKEKQRVVADRLNVLQEENQALQSRNMVLDMAVGTEKTRFQELKNKYDALEQRELGLIKRDEWFREHLEKSDSSNTAQINELTKQVVGLENRVRELSEENDESTRAIERAKLLVSRMDNLKLEASRRQAEIDGLQVRIREREAMLTRAVEEGDDLKEQLDEFTETVTRLEQEKGILAGRVEEKAHQVVQEREKARSMKDELERVVADRATKSERIISLEAEAKGQGKEILRLVDAVARLGDEVAETKDSLGTETGRVKLLEETEKELRSSLETLRGQYNEAVRARADHQSLLEKEQSRCEQLEQDKKGLTVSLEELRSWQLDAVRQLAELDEKNRVVVTRTESSTKELEREISKLKGEIFRKEQEISQAGKELSKARESLGWREKSHSAIMATTTKRINSMNEQIVDLTKRLSQTKDSLCKSESQAEESVQELQGFLARLCLISPGDSGIFEGLARQVQVRSNMQSQRPAQVSGWSILTTWGEKEEEEEVEVAQLPSGLEMMVLELFRAAVTGRISTRRCHLVLERAIQLVSTSPTIHTGVFSELASVFVKAVEAQPRDGFEAGLAFWQLLSVVEQRWQVDLAGVKDSLTAMLEAHKYGDVLAIIMGHKSPGESEECHFFSDTRAVLARDGVSSAALIDTRDRSIRFFARSRWTATLWAFIINPPASQEAIRLEFKGPEDLKWAYRIR